jgi:hypothetical protein
MHLDSTQEDPMSHSFRESYLLSYIGISTFGFGRVYKLFVYAGISLCCQADLKIRGLPVSAS